MKQGFTLIELLVVITILAILAGAALPYVQGYVQDARIAKAKADLDEISRALAVYEMKEGDYPITNVSLLTGRYLNKSPTDPWGQVYGVKTAQGIVFSSGPDKRSSVTTGNAGDDTDNIIAYYQPPLALVSAKWVDSNQSGVVDGTPPADKIILGFSRKLNNVNSQFDTAVKFNNNLLFDNQPIMNTYFVTAGGPPVGQDPAISTDKRSLVLTLVNGAPLIGLRSDSIRVNPGAGLAVLQDENGTICLSGQDVFIIEQ